MLAFPATASAHENGWHNWSLYRAAHPIVEPEIKRALTPTTAEVKDDYEDALRKRWKNWQEFDAAYWQRVEAQQEQEEEEPVAEVGVVAAGTALCDWSCILCESGGNPQAVSPSGTYYGLYQYDFTSWIADSGDPSLYGNAPASYQHWVASHASFDRWPNC